MKLLIYCFGILIACSHKERLSSSDCASIVNSPSEISSTENHNVLDSTGYAYELIKKCKLIPSGFDKKNVLSVKTITRNDVDLSLIKIEGNSQYSKWNGDPIYNLLIIHASNEIRYFKSISSVYDNDFVFFKKIDSNYVFENYSSTVGYTVLIVVDEKKDIYFSDKIPEEQTVIPESINPAESFIKVKNIDDKILLKRLFKTEWERCP